MDYIKELEKHIEKEKIKAISVAIFKTHTNPNGRVHKQNTTVEKYCIDRTRNTESNPEDYAKELLSILTGPTVDIKECLKCLAFLPEGKEHKCESYKLNPPMV